MRNVVFTPSNNRERQLVRDHGNFWTAVKEMNCPCFDGARGVFIVSLNEKHMRWTRAENVD